MVPFAGGWKSLISRNRDIEEAVAAFCAIAGAVEFARDVGRAVHACRCLGRHICGPGCFFFRRGRSHLKSTIPKMLVLVIALVATMDVAQLCHGLRAADWLMVIHGITSNGCQFPQARQCSHDQMVAAAKGRARVTAPSAVLLRSYGRAFLAMQELAVTSQQVQFAGPVPAVQAPAEIDELERWCEHECIADKEASNSTWNACPWFAPRVILQHLERKIETIDPVVWTIGD